MITPGLGVKHTFPSSYGGKKPTEPQSCETPIVSLLTDWTEAAANMLQCYL